MAQGAEAGVPLGAPVRAARPLRAAARRSRQRYPGNLYQGEVAAADLALGRLLDGLAAEGAGRRTPAGRRRRRPRGGARRTRRGRRTGSSSTRASMHVPLIVAGRRARDPSGGRRRDGERRRHRADAARAARASAAGRAPTGCRWRPALTGKGPLPARPGVLAESHTPRIQYGWSGLRAFVRGADEADRGAARPSCSTWRRTRRSDRTSRPRAPSRSTPRGAAWPSWSGARGAAAPQESGERAVSEEEMAQLRALGYAASGRRAAEGELVDRDGGRPEGPRARS